jgi:NADP-dependent 3-hydroxy acid dehydrogenase YdfG
MRPRGTGHIVNIASIAGKAGFPGVATYCATKHGWSGCPRRSGRSCAAATFTRIMAATLRLLHRLRSR